MSEERVDEALRALRRADWNVEASEGAEVRALLKFRRQRRKRQLRRAGLAVAIPAIAAALLLAVRAPAPQPQPRPAVAHAMVPAPAPAPLPVSIDRPVQRTLRKQEIVTPFYPLMPSAPPLESAVLVRVTVQAAAMRSVGIPVSDEHLTDPVLAEVLVGQDDLARAIRFVSYQ